MKEHLKKIFKQPATYKWLVVLVASVLAYFNVGVSTDQIVEIAIGAVAIFAGIGVIENSDAVKDAIKEGAEISKKAPKKEVKK